MKAEHTRAHKQVIDQNLETLMMTFTRRFRGWKIKRLTLVVVSCAVSLLIGGGVPASADNGPHVKGVSPNMISDACASCHRAHTAKAPYLLKQSQETLCFTCHGTGVLGANTDVQDGVGYSGAARTGTA